jgi:hypothetical protein
LKQAASDFSDRLSKIALLHLYQQSEKLIDNLRNLHVHDLTAVQRETEQRLSRFSRDFFTDCWSALDSGLQDFVAEKSPVVPVEKSPVVPTAEASDVEPSSAQNSMVNFLFQSPDNEPKVVVQQHKKSAPAPPVGKPAQKHTLTPDDDLPPPKQGRVLVSPISITSDTSEGVVTTDTRDNASKWNIGKIPIKCNTVIIGDSNLANWPKQERCFVKSFRGAHLVDITRILVDWDPPTHVSSLVIAAGVNNYVKTDQQNASELEELLLVINNFHFKAHFVEVHLAPLHTAVASARLMAINAKALERFGDLFIKLKMPLKFVDSQHYDKESASFISKQVLHFLR